MIKGSTTERNCVKFAGTAEGIAQFADAILNKRRYSIQHCIWRTEGERMSGVWILADNRQLTLELLNIGRTLRMR
jgi:hypothetical protein